MSKAAQEFPVVEFDPPDCERYTKTWSRVIARFAGEIEHTAPEVLDDLRVSVFEPFRDRLPIMRAPVEDAIENRACELLFAEFERRYPGQKYGSEQRKQADAERDFIINPQGYDSRCSILLPSSTIWDTLNAIDNSFSGDLVELIPAREAIRDWARRWRLLFRSGYKDSFCSFAMLTLAGWDREGFDGEWGQYVPVHRGRCQMFVNRNDEEAALPLPSALPGFPGYQPYDVDRDYYVSVQFENWLDVQRQTPLFRDMSEAARAAVEKDYTDRMTAYCTTVDEYYDSCGWLRAQHRDALTRHLHWTVRVHVLGERFVDVARKPGCDATDSVNPRTVRAAVRRLINFIGLERREARKPPGRRKGSRNTQNVLRSLGYRAKRYRQPL